MPEQSDQSDLLKGAIYKLQDLVNRLDTYTKMQTDIADLRHDVDALNTFKQTNLTLSKSIESLAQDIKDLQNVLNNQQKDNPGVLTRLQQIDNFVDSMRAMLDRFNSDLILLTQHETEIRSFKVACEFCRDKVNAKFASLENLPERVSNLQNHFELIVQKHSLILESIEEDRKERKSLIRNFWLSFAGYLLTAIVGGAFMLAKQTADIERHFKEYDQYRTQHDSPVYYNDSKVRGKDKP